MNSDQFLLDVCIDNCILQVGTAKKVLAVANGKDTSHCRQTREQFVNEDLYFVGGVSSQRNFERARDQDIAQKNYIFFDYDIRKSNPDITDSEIKEFGASMGEILKEANMPDWRYIVYTGNGLHIYYFSPAPISVANRVHWKFGLLSLCHKIDAKLGDKLDAACINLARLGRLPGSYNNKNPATPKKVEIVAYQDKFMDLSIVEKEGLLEEKRITLENIKRMESLQKAHPTAGGVYESIDLIPVDEIMVKLTGWSFDGKNFFDANNKMKACFVADNKNALIHGGTDHLKGGSVGYGPFELVREMKKLDNHQTFEWFKKEYPSIFADQRPEIQAKDEPEVSQEFTFLSVDQMFDELAATTFEQLKMNDPKLYEMDNMKFLIRGAVTRIGAYSNMGKSKMAYFLSHRLLRQKYHGIIFSTEVPRPIVLANMLVIETGKQFWDLIDKRYIPSELDKVVFRNLAIYDVTHTTNSLVAMEKTILNHIKNNRKPDFIVIDFVQAVMPKDSGEGEYERMSKYALDVQMLAQKYNVCVIDLSQISNEGLRDEFSSSGQIPFKGSGGLYASADVGIMLKRDKKSADPFMDFDIRKHKYLPPREIKLQCDFTKGVFSVFGHEFNS